MEQEGAGYTIIETVNINISWKLKTARTREITKEEITNGGQAGAIL